MENIFLYTSTSNYRRLIEALLVLRALLFLGTRYTCPCCGWRLRAFTHGGASLRVRHKGYCPRCNSKQRHRRDWLFLQENTNLFSEQLRLFHVAPKYSLSRRFITMPNLNYVAVDLQNRPNTSIRMDLASTPIRSNIFDALICIHVLEHIQDDLTAIGELFRVLKPGGWALITVPIRLDQKTYEDQSITSAQEREQHFGEDDHVRLYGKDLIQRLEGAGFKVQLHLASEVEEETREKYGLLVDENIFYCTKTEST